MIDILTTYGRVYLWTDGYQWTGLAVTCWLLVLSIAFGLTAALPLAIARVSKRRALWIPVWCFSHVFRGTPLYVQLLFFYFGVFSLDFVRQSPLLSSFFREGFYCAVFAFALNTCAYTTEIIAGAIKATAFGEVEAAKACGMSTWTCYRRIILPSALRRALPAYSNEVIILLHATSVAFTATVPELLKVARDVNATTYKTFTAFGIAGVLYLCVSFVLVWGFRLAERRWMAHLRPRSSD